MKGLMVSLIIIIFAGMTSNSVMAIQQAGEEAAGFMPRLRPIPAFERPGPDDSTDDAAYPAPTSLLNRNSTVTSRSNQSGSQSFGAPTSGGPADKNIRFEVTVDNNAIELLRQGRIVSSQVNVKDESTNANLHPSVVSDIALFHGANSGKSLQGIRLEPQPMEPGSTTLRFEIQEQQLDRIEKDAFLFSVPEQLRGHFDLVEFVAVGNSNDQSRPPVFPSSADNNFRFENTNGGDRFSVDQPNRFEDPRRTSGLDRWQTTNQPRPGPNFEPGGSDFTGPYIDPSELESRRNQVASIEPNRNYVQRNLIPRQPDIDRFPVNTTGGFQNAQQNPETQPKRSPFGRTWEQPENNQNGFNRGQPDQQDRFSRQNTFPQQVTNQQNNQSQAQQQLRSLQQRLDDAMAAKERVQQDAVQWQQAANTMQQQRNELGNQLRVVNGRPVAQQQPTNYQQIYNPSYWDNLNTATNLVKPYSNQRVNIQKQETAFNGNTQNQSEMERKIDTILARTYDLENRVARQRRDGPAEDEVQQTAYQVDHPRTADAKHAYESGRPAYVPPGTPRSKMSKERQSKEFDDGDGDGNKQRSSSRADLIWLILLLLGSLALNLFLWLHSRSLHLQYTDLAVELREMVGASTI